MRDFFVSYNKADKTWAEWIAWQLEEAGYTTILQAWDFRPSENFVIRMNDAIRNSERTLAVLSPDYLDAIFTQPEWAAAFAQDPTSDKGLLLPVRVRECNVLGLFSQIIYVDLVGKDESGAREALLSGLQRGRAKPIVTPGFPGSIPRSISKQPSFPGPGTKRVPFKTLIITATGLLISSSFLWTQWRDSKQEPQPKPFGLESARHSSEIDFTLYPGSVRGDGERSTVISSAGVRVLRLHLLLIADKYQSYQGRLLTEDDRLLAVVSDLQANIQDSDKAVIMQLPAQGLGSGDYRIELSGRTTNGVTQEIATYYFRLVNR